MLRQHARGLAGLAAYALLWGGAVATMAATKAGGAGDAIAVMVVIGVGFSLVGWLVTLGERPPAVAVRRPGLEMAVVLAYLAAYAVFFTGWGLSAFISGGRAG